jgi:hypothetical protein
MTVSRINLRRKFAGVPLGHAVWPIAVAEGLNPISYRSSWRLRQAFSVTPQRAPLIKQSCFLLQRMPEQPGTLPSIHRLLAKSFFSS